MTRKRGKGSQIKPWSSGRILTSAQRERKRWVNRVRCEKHREDTQGSLKSIERRISLAEQQLSKQKKLDRNLVKSNGQQASSGHGDPMVNLIPSIVRSGAGAVTPCQSEELDFVCFPRDNDPTITRDGCVSQLAETRHVSIGANLRDLTFSLDMSYLCHSTKLLGAIHHLHKSQVSLNDEINQDALICGVVEGWHVMARRKPCCPIWNILRQIDTSIKIRSGAVTRLTMLRGMHLLLLCFLFPERYHTLPTWYRPRQSQVLYSQDIVSDYFAWPQLRDRLALTHRPELNNNFWHYFAKCFRFIWPHRIQEAIEMDSASGLYRLSKSFYSCTQEVDRYTMDPEFFSIYPDMRAEILNVA